MGKNREQITSPGVPTRQQLSPSTCLEEGGGNSIFSYGSKVQ